MKGKQAAAELTSMPRPKKFPVRFPIFQSFRYCEGFKDLWIFIGKQRGKVSISC